MRISTRFSNSIHILAFIETYKGKLPLSSEHIAAMKLLRLLFVD